MIQFDFSKMTSIYCGMKRIVAYYELHTSMSPSRLGRVELCPFQFIWTSVMILDLSIIFFKQEWSTIERIKIIQLEDREKNHRESKKIEKYFKLDNKGLFE